MLFMRDLFHFFCLSTQRSGQLLAHGIQITFGIGKHLLHDVGRLQADSKAMSRV